MSDSSADIGVSGDAGHADTSHHVQPHQQPSDNHSHSATAEHGDTQPLPQPHPGQMVEAPATPVRTARPASATTPIPVHSPIPITHTHPISLVSPMASTFTRPPVPLFSAISSLPPLASTLPSSIVHTPAKARLNAYLVELVKNSIKITDDFSAVCRAKVEEKEEIIARLTMEIDELRLSLSAAQPQQLTTVTETEHVNDSDSRQKSETEEKQAPLTQSLPQPQPQPQAQSITNDAELAAVLANKDRRIEALQRQLVQLRAAAVRETATADQGRRDLNAVKQRSALLVRSTRAFHIVCWLLLAVLLLLCVAAALHFRDRWVPVACSAAMPYLSLQGQRAFAGSPTACTQFVERARYESRQQCEREKDQLHHELSHSHSHDHSHHGHSHETQIKYEFESCPPVIPCTACPPLICPPPLPLGEYDLNGAHSINPHDGDAAYLLSLSKAELVWQLLRERENLAEARQWEVTHKILKSQWDKERAGSADCHSQKQSTSSQTHSVADLTPELEVARSSLSACEARFAITESSLNESRTLVESAQSHLSNVTKALQQCQHDSDVAMKRATAELTESESQLTRATEDRQRLEADIESKSAEITTLNERMAQIIAETNTAPAPTVNASQPFADQLDPLSLDLLTCQQENTAMMDDRMKLDTAAEEARALSSVVDQLRAQLSRNVSLATELRANLTALEASLAVCDTAHSSLQSELESKDSASQSAQSERRELEERIHAGQLQLTACEIRLNETLAVHDDMTHRLTIAEQTMTDAHHIIEELRQQQTLATATSTILEPAVAELRRQVERAESQLDAALKQFASMQPEDLAAGGAGINDATINHRALEACESENTELRSELTTVRTTLFEAKSNMSMAAYDSESAQLRIDDLEARIAELRIAAASPGTDSGTTASTTAVEQSRLLSEHEMRLIKEESEVTKSSLRDCVNNAATLQAQLEIANRRLESIDTASPSDSHYHRTEPIVTSTSSRFTAPFTLRSLIDFSRPAFVPFLPGIPLPAAFAGFFTWPSPYKVLALFVLVVLDLVIFQLLMVSRHRLYSSLMMVTWMASAAAAVHFQQYFLALLCSSNAFLALFVLIQPRAALFACEWRCCGRRRTDTAKAAVKEVSANNNGKSPAAMPSLQMTPAMLSKPPMMHIPMPNPNNANGSASPFQSATPLTALRPMTHTPGSNNTPAPSNSMPPRPPMPQFSVASPLAGSRPMAQMPAPSRPPVPDLESNSEPTPMPDYLRQVTSARMSIAPELVDQPDISESKQPTISDRIHIQESATGESRRDASDATVSASPSDANQSVSPSSREDPFAAAMNEPLISPSLQALAPSMPPSTFARRSPPAEHLSYPSELTSYSQTHSSSQSAANSLPSSTGHSRSNSLSGGMPPMPMTGAGFQPASGPMPPLRAGNNFNFNGAAPRRADVAFEDV